MEDIKGILTFTDQELYCLARHIKFYFQTHWQEKTDLGEPCETCPGCLFCKINFIEVFQKLGDLTGEKIQTLEDREPNGYTYNLTKEAVSGGRQPLTENELRYLRSFAENEAIAAFANHMPAEQQ